MIRKAEPKDVVRLMEMTQALFESSKYHESLGVTYDLSSAVTCLLFHIKTKDCVLLVMEKENEIVGFLMGQKIRWFFNQNEFLGTSLYWYVEPEHRKGLGSIELLKAFESWAKENGCVGLDTGTTVKLQGERVSQLFEKMGYPEQGMSHAKRLKRVGYA